MQNTQAANVNQTAERSGSLYVIRNKSEKPRCLNLRKTYGWNKNIPTLI